MIDKCRDLHKNSIISPPPPQPFISFNLSVCEFLVTWSNENWPAIEVLEMALVLQFFLYIGAKVKKFVPVRIWHTRIRCLKQSLSLPLLSDHTLFLQYLIKTHSLSYLFNSTTTINQNLLVVKQ